MENLSVEQLCELGSEQLMRTAYLDAIDTLAEAEAMAWERRDWDLLSRVHMPLQEATRQARLVSLEGAVVMNLLEEQGKPMDVGAVLERHPRGQLLIGGWGSVGPAVLARRLARERRLNVEVFLGAVFAVAGEVVVAVVPTDEVVLPAAVGSLEELAAVLPWAVIFRASELRGAVARPGLAEERFVLELWERLHRPFLAAADGEGDLVKKIEGFRRTLLVDRACELAHQDLSIAARELARAR